MLLCFFVSVIICAIPLHLLCHRRNQHQAAYTLTQLIMIMIMVIIMIVIIIITLKAI